ncbi:efflux RND transporter permease subunit [Alkalimarinus coralli]|uniref:efflux RND transporter permease subunit n=1 Tax=Alkalimarinus coralli TaxID=2935863 RepID=UPI00202B6BAB|nr:efflux RND transporter permease subunit [Alkalimarinus coralli]
MHGLIAWFARNAVAANLLMLTILGLGGFSLAKLIPLEVFPNIERDAINIAVGYSAASPEEIEEGVSILIEEAIFDLEGIEKITSQSFEGAGVVTAELEDGYDKRDLLNDIKSRVDAINDFPADADRPSIAIAEYRREVISVVVSGEQSEKELRIVAEQVRDELNNLPEVTQVFLESTRAYEIAIEIPERTLREYNLSMADIADAVQKGSFDLSAGSVRTAGGEIFIRTKGQAYQQEDFEKITVLTREDGTRLTLKDLAVINDGFEENPVKIRFNNRQGVLIEVYRVGNQSAITIANAVKAYVEEVNQRMPEGISVGYWRDSSRIVKGRLNTLINSALQGGVLVLVLLALFLRPAVAFWVCLGIPISFMGGFLTMPFFDVSLNIFSLFAFIMVLGIVVDDAIVTGENIYAHFQHHDNPMDAVIRGTQEVSVPVTFGVLTTIAAFIPLALIEGRRSILFGQIPLIVVPVLLFSLVESKWILPAHLRHLKMLPSSPSEQGWLTRIQQRIANGLESAILKYYRPTLKKALSHRYLTLSLFIGAGIIIIALITSGWTRFIFFPRVESETARAILTMPAGTAFETTDQYIEQITVAAQALQEKYKDENGKSVIKNILSSTGHAGGTGSGNTHNGRVLFEVESPETRTVDIGSTELVREWRKMIGDIPGAESLTYRAEIGRSGDPIDIQLSGQSFKHLRAVADQLKQHLSQYAYVFDIGDSLSGGKQERQIKLKPTADLLGLSLADITQQVRRAFWGFEVQRIQRGRDDVKVMVRYPASERRSINSLDTMLIRTATGYEVPFNQVAELLPGTSPASITRINRARTLNVTADINKQLADIEAIKRDINQFMAEVLPRYQGISYTLEGEAREQQESFHSLWLGMLGLLFVIYALLAIPFGSYLQPLIVMSVIPFGAMGAIIGHWIMGMDLTLLSLMGMLALSGVVVNDSLVLVDYINRHSQNAGKQRQKEMLHAISNAGAARFRPVLLTSLTTFAGLMPLIFEKSTQAQFLIPMAVSLGFGIIFATAITLILVPVNYMILEDLKALYRKPEAQTSP